MHAIFTDFGIATFSNETVKNVDDYIYIAKVGNSTKKNKFPMGHKGSMPKSSTHCEKRYKVHDMIAAVYSVLILYGIINARIFRFSINILSIVIVF